MTYQYGISGGDEGAIFRVGVFHSLAFHCKILKTALKTKIK